MVDSTAIHFSSPPRTAPSRDGEVPWERSPPPRSLQLADPANVYKGLAQAVVGGFDYAYAANFATGTIDVLKGTDGAPDLVGNFTDPGLPAGYAPFNVQTLGGTIYVPTL